MLSAQSTMQYLKTAAQPRTCHGNLITGLGVTQEVGAEALFGGVVLSHLLVPVLGTTDAQRCGLAVELVSISAGSNRIQTHTVRHLLAPGVDLGTLQ